MDALSWAVLASALLAGLAILSKCLNQKSTSKKQHPPGPKPWPIIGNLNLVNGSIPHVALHKLSESYGEIMQLKFGSRPVVVASSPDMAKQFLMVHGHNFASRPVTAAGEYTAYNFSDMTWAPYGPYWRQARRLYLTEIFTPKRLESYEYIRVEERRNLISRLHSLSGKPVQLRDHLVRFTLTSTSRMVLGSNKYFSESESQNSVATAKDLQDMLDEWFLLNGVYNIGDWIPWLGFLDLQGYVKRMKALHKKFDRFHNHVLDEHIARRMKEGKDFEAKDMVDVLLELADDPHLEVKLTRDNVKALVQDLIAGGTDTSAITVEWAISELLKRPYIFKKATEELDRVIGRERWVEEKDLPQLPYIDSIMTETMRLHPAATLLAPHLAIEDSDVAGYHVGKGTSVLVNVWSIGRNPAIWDSPDKFLPERFLGKEVDVKGQNFELLPFGSGRRMCPGYRLGLCVIKSTLANLLHGFHWKLPEGVRPEDIGMEELYGLTTHREIPIVPVVEPRLPTFLYH